MGEGRTEAVLSAGDIVADVVEDAAAEEAHDEGHGAVHGQQRGVANNLRQRAPEQHRQLTCQRRPRRLLVLRAETTFIDQHTHGQRS